MSTAIATKLGLGGTTGSDLLKSKLQIEHANDDALLTELIDMACARMQERIVRHIVSAQETEYFDGGGRVFHVKHFPIDTAAGVTITDTHGTNDATDDETVDAIYYRIDDLAGMIHRTSSVGGPGYWGEGKRRFKAVYTGGLDKHPDWTTVVLPDLKLSALDCAADFYENGNPRLLEEREGGGFGVKLALDAIPPRIMDVWRRYMGDLP